MHNLPGSGLEMHNLLASHPQSGISVSLYAAAAALELEKAVEINPTNSSLRLNLGVTYAMLGRTAEAILDAEPDNDMAQRALRVLGGPAPEQSRGGLQHPDCAL
jgi:hypothetical protein